MNKIRKAVAATALAVLAVAGVGACQGSGEYLPNGMVTSKWSRHTTSSDQYWLQVKYSTTGNSKNYVIGTYRVTRATYLSCQPGFLTQTCRRY